MNVELPNGTPSSPQDTRTNDPKTWPNGLYAYSGVLYPSLAIFNGDVLVLGATNIHGWGSGECVLDPKGYRRIPGYTGNFTKLVAEVE